MAMNGNILGAELALIITAPDAPPFMQDQILELWQKIATTIVMHIQTQALVNPGIPVATAGSAAAQTGATTGPGTIS